MYEKTYVFFKIFYMFFFAIEVKNNCLKDKKQSDSPDFI